MCSAGSHLDTTLNVLEENRFKKKYSNLIRQLTKKLPFSYEELECIFVIYYKIQKSLGDHHKEVTKKAITDFLYATMDITDMKAIDRIIAASFKNTGPYTTIEDFVQMIALFLRGTKEQKMDFCYDCYTSISFKGTITRDVMNRSLQNCIISPDDDNDDLVSDFVEMIQKKMDLDRDNAICFEEYVESVQKLPLLMEFLGPCIPSRLAAHSFACTFTEFPGKF